MKRSGIGIYMPAEGDAWLLLALDMRALAARAGRSDFACVRGLTLCANMSVRTAFSSSVKYDWQVSARRGGWAAEAVDGRAH